MAFRALTHGPTREVDDSHQHVVVAVPILLGAHGI